MRLASEVVFEKCRHVIRKGDPSKERNTSKSETPRSRKKPHIIEKENRVLCSEKKVWLHLNGDSIYLIVYS